MTFADKSKELRAENGITQGELAKELNLSRSCISMIEIGRNEPTASTLIAYANFFGLPIDELLGRDEFTPAERAAGFSETRKMNVTPIEEDAVYIVRQIGKRFGEQAQRDYLTVGENMLKLK